jgi:hypothetical protein
MAKFYVQSGNLKMVLQARDSRCAAIWAAHRTLGDSLPIVKETTVGEISTFESPAEEVTNSADGSRLGETIRVSQRGFDRRDSTVYETLDIVSEWSRLLVALERLTAAMAQGS